MGSFFAGIKAGTLAGIVYVAGMAMFNVVLLYADKKAALDFISNQYSSICPAGNSTVTSGVETCFQQVVTIYVPLYAFIDFFIALIYAGLFGMFYDSVPAKSPVWKGMTFAAIVGFNLIFFGFFGFNFDTTSATATSAFLVAWTVLFGYLLGKLYRRYTRTVQFSSLDPALLKVIVDGREVTGKARTFARTSSHKLRAEVAEDASFKEWAPSGGVTLEDTRSFETSMEVNEDGTVKGNVGAKY